MSDGEALECILARFVKMLVSDAADATGRREIFDAVELRKPVTVSDTDFGVWVPQFTQPGVEGRRDDGRAILRGVEERLIKDGVLA